MPPPEPLTHLVRPPAGEPIGLLVLFHGRGADERDLFPLLDLLDPERRMLGVTPRGPLQLPPGQPLTHLVRPPVGEPTGLLSSSMDAAPTSAISSRCSICSTPSDECSA